MKWLKKIWHFFRPELEIMELKIPDFFLKLRSIKGKWNKHVCTISWFQKDNGEKIADFALWTNGKPVLKYLLDEEGNELVKKTDKVAKSGRRQRTANPLGETHTRVQISPLSPRKK